MKSLFSPREHRSQLQSQLQSQLSSQRPSLRNICAQLTQLVRYATQLLSILVRLPGPNALIIPFFSNLNPSSTFDGAERFYDFYRKTSYILWFSLISDSSFIQEFLERGFLEGPFSLKIMEMRDIILKGETCKIVYNVDEFVLLCSKQFENLNHDEEIFWSLTIELTLCTTIRKAPILRR